MFGGHGHSHGDKPCDGHHGDAGSAPNAGVTSNRTVAEQAAPLRFALGSKVECKMSPTMWMKGTVVACNYREAGWPADKPAIPYQVELTKSKDKIFAPYDFEDIIRADTAPHTSEGGAAGDGGFAGVPVYGVPLTFTGARLLVNVKTSGEGGLRVALSPVDAAAGVRPGLTIDDCVPVSGDAMDVAVGWAGHGTNVSAWAGMPVRLTLELTSGDLFSFGFAE